MNKIAGILFSARLMGVILSVFAVSIAFATFIENDFGSHTARALVYNARWFELLLLLGVINLTGRIFQKKLHTRSKLSIFTFHIAFVLILAGSAITRYTGSEGTMHIREGSSEDRVLSDKTFLTVVADKVHHYSVSYSPFNRYRFTREFLHQQNPVKIRSVSFVPNAYETIEPATNGEPVAEFIYADSTGRRSVVIAKGQKKSAGKIMLNFKGSSSSNDVELSFENDSLLFRFNFPVTVASMDGSSYGVLQPGRAYSFLIHHLYSFNGQSIVLNTFYPEGKLKVLPLPENAGATYDALVIEVMSADSSREVVLRGKAGHPGIKETVSLNGKDLILSYGSIYENIPFKLELEDFLIERYPGSQSPSSFESRVVLTDTSRDLRTPYRIYMNNILKYKGYRFYQSSYDTDEKGTILSVNHDMAGTTVTYAGYFIMALGMVLSLFIPKSRFRAIFAEWARIRRLKNAIILIIIIQLSNTISFANEGKARETGRKDHFALFGKLLVQDNNGRIEPVNTLSSEVVRKLAGTNVFRGMSSDEVFHGMVTNPLEWQNEPLIKVTHPEVLNLLGTKEKYHSFVSFFRNHQYILQSHVARAYQKKPAQRSRFDNEIIRLDEKVNICYLVFTGEFLRIFPVRDDSTHTWYSPIRIGQVNHFEDSVFTNNIWQVYVSEVQKAYRTGDWSEAGEMLNAISQYQSKFSGPILPSEQKIRTEIFLNKSNIFSGLAKYYGIFGLLLLVIQFFRLFNPRLKVKIPVFLLVIIIVIMFCIHTAGLGMRWYVSGHAPWSNGYEALITVAWACVGAGLIFSFMLPLTISIGSILGFLTLFVAHLSWMDPQITNLVPVLKSNWLVIHVATIMISYGFLAIGALLAFINLALMAAGHTRNRLFIRHTIREITGIIEMALTIGLYTLTIGVFLGAVWANESWGRYWGWDPKETWALVTVLVYAFVLHMRMIPELKGVYTFNLAALLAFSSVLMTYFGVNYYLSGLHSYAKGDPLPVPSFVYYTLGIVVVTAIIARIRYSEPEQAEKPTEAEAVQ